MLDALPVTQPTVPWHWQELKAVAPTRENLPAFFIHQLTRDESDVASFMLSPNANTAQNSNVKTPKEHVKSVTRNWKFFSKMD